MDREKVRAVTSLRDRLDGELWNGIVPPGQSAVSIESVKPGVADVVSECCKTIRLLQEVA